MATKEQGAGHYGFVDMFIPPQNTGTVGRRACSVLLGLKYITLLDLWDGETETWKRQYIHKQLEDFKGKIHKEDEQNLLARKYMYYSKDLRKAVVTTVGDYMGDATKQLKTYMDIVARDILYYDSGVPDNRVKIKEGMDNLQGHVIIIMAIA
ncbi:9341_t:CDS:1, partial [Paraglomus occultum]